MILISTQPGAYSFHWSLTFLNLLLIFNNDADFPKPSVLYLLCWKFVVQTSIKWAYTNTMHCFDLIHCLYSTSTNFVLFSEQISQVGRWMIANHAQSRFRVVRIPFIPVLTLARLNSCLWYFVQRRCVFCFYVCSFWRLSEPGRNEGGKGGTIPWALIHYMGAEPLRRAPKVPTMPQVLSSMQYICFRSI